MKTAPRDPKPVSVPMFKFEAGQQYQDHAEASFRRGFHQACSDIYVAMLAGATLEQLGWHLDNVEAWRQDTESELGFAPPMLIDSWREDGR